MMTNTPAALLLMLLRISQAIVNPSKDARVTCAFLDDCTLPCSFRPAGAVVIHWYKQQIPVHSYYYNRDQFGLQNKHFSGRTGLFDLQIAHGNASLVLRKVKVQDRGRYKCYTSTRKENQEMFVNLGVKAPIQTVKLDVLEDELTCTAQNVYPAPHLLWSTDPPTDTARLHNRTHVSADARGLFTIEGTIDARGNMTQHTYFCSVASADGSQVWTASARHQEEIFGEEGGAVLIPCLVARPRHNFTLTWTFRGSGEGVAIFSYDSRTRRTFNLWESRAELDVERAYLGNASLTLLEAESSAHSGTYTCTVSSFQVKHRVQTRVNVTLQVTDADEGACERSWWGTAASVFIFLLIISVALTRCFRHREQQKTRSHASDKGRGDPSSSSGGDISPVPPETPPPRPNGRDTRDPELQDHDEAQTPASPPSPAECVTPSVHTDPRSGDGPGGSRCEPGASAVL